MSQVAVLAVFILLICAAVLAANGSAGDRGWSGAWREGGSPVVIAAATTKPVLYDVTTIGRIQPIASV